MPCVGRVSRRMFVAQPCGVSGPDDPSLAKEGVSAAPARATPTLCLQELSSAGVALRCAERVSGYVARRRACPRVPASPKMYPSRTRDDARFRRSRQHNMPIYRAFVRSPLTDSNRRPPPYHRGVTRVHARSFATQFLLHIGMKCASRMRRETPRVSFLMCPFCVRALLRDVTTQGFSGGDDVGTRHLGTAAAERARPGTGAAS